MLLLQRNGHACPTYSTELAELIHAGLQIEPAERAMSRIRSAHELSQLAL